ncbi:hypothetical protein CRUP_004233 [Coryphaenoides rupestris]|nr:hypothetical protein CRUP_004233 [Coryphaenoides rupestris]
MVEKKCSARVDSQRRVLDEATRQRRLSRQLEALEKDNFQDDPLASLPPQGPAARLPAFSDTEDTGKKRRKTRGDHFKQRFRKNFTALLEEENLSERAEPNYLSAGAPPSSLPPRSFCSSCGFPSHYTCTSCGGRYCCTRCLLTHTETRSSLRGFRTNKMVEKKCSARVDSQRRVLDEATRQRRLSRQLEALEKDNFQDDPLASLPPQGPAARLPAFSDTEDTGKKRRKTRGDHFKQRFRKNFTALLEEENLSERAEPNYLSAGAPPSSLPPRSFCSSCGFPSHYTCTSCGGRYCCTRCLLTHTETRCLKWTL